MLCMRSKSVLITRPNHDVETNYLCKWSERVIALARKKQYTVYDLLGQKAARKNLESYLKAQKPPFLFLNGHGNKNEIAGQDNEVLIDSSSKFKGVIIYARSCDAGKVLGRKLVKKGATAFIGYMRKFVFSYTESKIIKPLQDNIAKLFLEPSNLVASTILKGHSASEGNERSKKAMYKNFNMMIASTASYEERYASRWLWANLRCQVLIGNGEASLSG